MLHIGLEDAAADDAVSEHSEPLEQEHLKPIQIPVCQGLVPQSAANVEPPHTADLVVVEEACQFLER